MKKSANKKVLVLDSDMVPALTIARSLKARGCEVFVAGHIPRSISSYSRAVCASYEYPDPLADKHAFLHWLQAHCRTNKYDLVIPVTERTLVPISAERQLFKHVHVAMPAKDSLDLALDKEQTMELARGVGVPIPGSIAINGVDDLRRHTSELRYPVVIKPSRSLSNNSNGASQLKVGYAFSEGELNVTCRQALNFGPLLLQEYFGGQGMGVELIAQQGQIVYAFQHLRLHEVPLTGGGSTLRKSVPLEPALLEAAERLIGALRWNGVAMVEFKWRPETGEFTLMEINGRFWGSLPLADAAGADFPSMLLDLELDGEVGPHPQYRPDVYCRKFSSDLYWYEAVMRRGPEDRIADLPGGWEIIKEMRLFFMPRHYFDVQSFVDPLPGLVDLRDIAVSYCQRIAALIDEKWFFWRQRRAWRSGEVVRGIAEARQILFICYGNINRSALADVLVRDYAQDCGFTVVSAGLHQEEGRPADPVMVDVARARGVELGHSQSTMVTPELLASSDLIFVMEKRHADALLVIDPSLRRRIYLLGAHDLLSRVRPEIADPYGRSRESYETCFEQISRAVDQVKSVLVFRCGEL